MTAGLNTALADSWLDSLSGTSFTPPAALYAQLHSGDPGAAGTANVIAGAPRVQVTSWNPAAAGSKTSASVPTWASWAGTSPVAATFVSFWDALTSGNFVLSGQVPGSGAQIVTGNTVQLTLVTITLAPLAA